MLPPDCVIDKERLLAFCDGKLSTVFGEAFQDLDSYSQRVRLPHPPYLFVDRILRLESEAKKLGPGKIVGELDIKEDAWALKDSEFPFSFTVEIGQILLVLASYQGVDLLNPGKTAGRVLGYELEVVGPPPKVGDTFEVEVTFERWAYPLVFFRSIGRVNGKDSILCHRGVAGFFTTDQLEKAAVAPTPESLAQVREWDGLRGIKEDLMHVPGDPRGKVIDEILLCEKQGKTEGSGQVVGKRSLSGDEWFFRCHFLEDPCVPASLLLEAGIQSMEAFGRSVDPRFERFQMTPQSSPKVKMKGSVTPKCRELHFAGAIKEYRMNAGSLQLLGDVKVYGDGAEVAEFKGIHLSSRLAEKSGASDAVEVAGYAEIASSSRDSASEVLGPDFAEFDRVEVLPRPPSGEFLFFHRVTSTTPEKIYDLSVEAEIECEYELRPEAWYFEGASGAGLPLSALLEIAAQSCSWLMAIPTLMKEWGPEAGNLYLRNLDGAFSVFRQLPVCRTLLKTRVRRKKVSKFPGCIVEFFKAQVFDGETPIAELDTSFGVFTEEAMSGKTGIKLNPSQYLSDEGSPVLPVSLEDVRGKFSRFPAGKVALLDRIVGYYPEGGTQGQGRVVSEREIRPDDWFFQHHFFNDPVMPGSFGLQAALETALAWMISQDAHLAVKNPTYSIVTEGGPIVYQYRGQIRPNDRRMKIVVDLREKEWAGSPRVKFDATIWVEGVCIYQIRNLQLQIVPAGEASPGVGLGIEGIARSLEHAESFRKALSDKLPPDSWKDCRYQVESGSGVKVFSPERPFHPHGFEYNPALRAYECRGPNAAGLDLSLFDEYWRRKLGEAYESFPVRRIYELFLNKFMGEIVLSDPKAFAAHRGKPCLYFANHQTYIESMMSGVLLSALGGVPVLGIAKAAHLGQWIGCFNDIATSYPGVNPDSSIYFIDRENPQKIFESIKEIEKLLKEGTQSLFIHIEGRRSYQAQDPVRKISSLWIDLCEKNDIPIVPVRFVGGLPRRTMERKFDFPFQFGRQSVLLGAPISAAKIKSLPLKDKNRAILDAINGLETVEDAPACSDLESEAKVAELRSSLRNDEAAAVVLQLLREHFSKVAAAISGEIGLQDPLWAAALCVERLLKDPRALELKVSEGPRGAWSRKFMQWLFPHHLSEMLSEKPALPADGLRIHLQG